MSLLLEGTHFARSLENLNDKGYLKAYKSETVTHCYGIFNGMTHNAVCINFVLGGNMKIGINTSGHSLLRLLQLLSMVIVLFFTTITLASAGAPDAAQPRAVGRAGAASSIQAGKAGLAGIAEGSKKDPEFVPDELLVKFRESVSEEKKERLHKEHGARKLKEYKPLRLHRVKLKEGDMVKDAAARYKEDPDVEYAEPNFIVSSESTPTDPKFSDLWGMAKINAPAAWDKTTGSNNVVVAIIDTGIDFTHPDRKSTRLNSSH